MGFFFSLQFSLILKNNCYKQKYENKQATSHVRYLAHDSKFKQNHEKCQIHG
jgi:hypothetical protein